MNESLTKRWERFLTETPEANDLSKKEQAVLRLLMEGKTYDKITKLTDIKAKSNVNYIAKKLVAKGYLESIDGRIYMRDTGGRSIRQLIDDYYALKLKVTDLRNRLSKYEPV